MANSDNFFLNIKKEEEEKKNLKQHFTAINFFHICRFTEELENQVRQWDQSAFSPLYQHSLVSLLNIYDPSSGFPTVKLFVDKDKPAAIKHERLGEIRHYCQHRELVCYAEETEDNTTK